MRLCAPIAVVALMSCAWANTAPAAELSVLSIGEMTSSFRQIIPEFVESSDHNVVVEYASARSIEQRLLAGEKADLILVPGINWQPLLKANKVENPTLIASFGFGLGVQPGKFSDGSKTGGSAMTIGVVRGETDTTSARLSEVLKRRGLSAGKFKFYNSWFDLAAALSRGDVEMGLAPTVNLAEAGVNSVIDLPPEIRKPQLVTAFVTSDSGQKGLARALIRFLRGSKVQETLKANGLEPAHVNDPSAPPPTSQERGRRVTEFFPRIPRPRNEE